MNKAEKMDNSFYNVVGDYIFVFISFAGTYIGIDSLPENQTLIQSISTVQNISTVDIVQKIMTILSLCVSSVAGFIPIIKFINRNKNKKSDVKRG